MKYIGNYPEQEIVHTSADRYDYVYAGNPAIDTNPATPYATWLNALTGALFICVDNTVGINVWKSESRISAGAEIISGAGWVGEWAVMPFNTPFFGSPSIMDSTTNKIIVPPPYNRVGLSMSVQLDSSPEILTLLFEQRDSLDVVKRVVGMQLNPSAIWNALSTSVVVINASEGDYFVGKYYCASGDFNFWEGGTIEASFWLE